MNTTCTQNHVPGAYTSRSPHGVSFSVISVQIRPCASFVMARTIVVMGMSHRAARTAGREGQAMRA